MVLKEKQIFCAREGVPDRAVRAVDIGNEPIYAKVIRMKVYQVGM